MVNQSFLVEKYAINKVLDGYNIWNTDLFDEKFNYNKLNYSNLNNKKLNNKELNNNICSYNNVCVCTYRGSVVFMAYSCNAYTLYYFKI